MQKPRRLRDAEPEMFPRLKTGNSQADYILGGGFPAHSINIIMGQPGTGKTIFAEQLLFHNATPERPALYVSTLSEPLLKIVSYVQRFEFFEVERIGSDIQYEDLGPELATNGPEALMQWLMNAIKTQSPRIIVIDSFRALHDLGTSKAEMRRLIARLAALLSAYDVTAFLIGEYAIDDIQKYPEFAVADAIVQLARQTLSTKDERYFRVLKLRGSDYRVGQHGFRITKGGLEIYPRLVAPRIPEEYVAPEGRISTGVPGLDKLMDGGPHRGSATLVVGMTGTGKTTIALQFALEGIKNGEKVLYINFQENPAQLRHAISALGGDPDTVEHEGLHLMYASPVELQIDSIVLEMFDAIETGGVQRIIIDAVGDLAMAASDPQRLYEYLYSLIQHFAARGVSSLLTLESIGDKFTGITNLADQRFSYMSDNLIYLSWENETSGQRVLRVVKMRGSDHGRETRHFEITEKGARVK